MALAKGDELVTDDVLTTDDVITAESLRGYDRTTVPRLGDDMVIRVMDVLISGLAIIVTGPVLAILWLLVLSSSSGPGLFRQERLGCNRRPFTMFKLRTMYVNSDDQVHRAYVTRLLRDEAPQECGHRRLFKLESDPRITRLGALLRKTSLDELPQLINVIRGDMSLVGPRPALRWEAEMFRSSDMARFDVKPGITGLWQVSGRSRLSMREALDLDAEYVRSRSFLLNVVILLRTVPTLLRRDAA